MGIIQTAKDIVSIVQKMGNIDLIEKVLDLQTELSEIVEQLGEKEKTIEKLTEALELKGNLQREYSAYWLKDDQGNIIDGPFCTNCFDTEHTPRRLVQGGKQNGQGGHSWEWVRCPKCKVPFRSRHVGQYLNTH